MRRHTSTQLIRMKEDEKFVGVDWKMFSEYLPESLLSESQIEANPAVKQPFLAVSEQSSRLSTDQQDLADIDHPVIIPGSDIHVSLNDLDDEHIRNVRNELVVRFLTAMSIDYEKQWYLGMIHRRTLDILIKSVEEAKDKCSLQLHWQLLVKHFRLPFLLRHLIRLNHFDCIEKWTDNLLFDHILQTMELTFGSSLISTERLSHIFSSRFSVH